MYAKKIIFIVLAILVWVVAIYWIVGAGIKLRNSLDVPEYLEIAATLYALVAVVIGTGRIADWLRSRS